MVEGRTAAAGGEHSTPAIEYLPVYEQAPYGGYNCRFVQRVPNELVCNRCEKALHNPHLTVCCGQYFCESCLKHWFKECKEERCPYCHAERDKFQHVPNKAIERKVNELKIHCTSGSCGWVGELSWLQSHLKDCKFVDVTCTNKCVEKLKRKDLALHHNQCLLHQYKCEYCGHEEMYCTITGDLTGDHSHKLRYNSHYETCLNYPLKCPNKCGQGGIRRKDLNDHCEHCPLEPVDCPFRDAGCDMKPARKHLEMHMAAEMQQHLLLVMKVYQALQRRCDEIQLTRSSILASMDSLSETCTEDQREVLRTGRQSFRDRTKLLIDT